MAKVSLDEGLIKVERSGNVYYYPASDITVQTIGTSLDILRAGKIVQSFSFAEIEQPFGSTMAIKAGIIASWMNAPVPSEDYARKTSLNTKSIDNLLKEAKETNRLIRKILN